MCVLSVLGAAVCLTKLTAQCDSRETTLPQVCLSFLKLRHIVTVCVCVHGRCNGGEIRRILRALIRHGAQQIIRGLVPRLQMSQGA